MSERYMPHPDELIDHETEWLNYRIRQGRARELNWRWPDETQEPDYLNDPWPWDDRPNPLLDRG